ncbi:MAG: polysaccharide deacetylase family protein [Acidobacteriota bacterium]|jgi:peptidoglycan/xylan/chitin deacetylase (PgdA/CDA1 family)
MLKRVKQGLLGTARAIGALRGVADSSWRRNRLLILCYHSASLEQEHIWRPALYFQPDALEQRLRQIEAMRCAVLPLAEAVARVQSGTLPDRAVVLTFDDGMYDFWSVIWPMLQKRGWPATLYASTYYAEKQVPLFPLLCSYLLWRGRAGVLPAATIPGQTETIPLDTAGQRNRAQQLLLQHCEGAGLDAAARDGWAARLAEVLGIDVDAYRRKRLFGLMTAEEFAEAARQGVDVQLHTHRHRTPRDRALFLREIDDNRARLEDWTGRRLSHFCYPSGVHYQEFLPWLGERGIETATTCVPGLTLAGTNPLLLPRLVDTCGLSDVEFEGWLAGASQCLPRRAVTFG